MDNYRSQTNRFTKKVEMVRACSSENSIARETLRWNPQGKRKAGLPRNTWRKTILNEARERGWSSYDLIKVAINKSPMGIRCRGSLLLVELQEL
jgi:hypothetical protein